jgi:hypothetical protein
LDENSINVELRIVSQDEVNGNLGVGIAHQICQAFVDGSMQSLVNSSEFSQKDVVSVGDIAKETGEVVSRTIAEKATIASTTIDIAPIDVQDGAGVIVTVPLDSTNDPVILWLFYFLTHVYRYLNYIKFEELISAIIKDTCFPPKKNIILHLT